MTTVKREFDRDWLFDEVLDEDDAIDTIIEHGRWHVLHGLIFPFEGKHYRTSYRVGATESQEERPWENENPVVCEEVEAQETTVTVWRAVQMAIEPRNAP